MRFLKLYYTLAPLWFLVEVFIFPWRAGAIVGESAAWAAAFYAVEAGVGWGLRGNRTAALVAAVLENTALVTWSMAETMGLTLGFSGDMAAVVGARLDWAHRFPCLFASLVLDVVALKVAIAKLEDWLRSGRARLPLDFF